MTAVLEMAAVEVLAPGTETPAGNLAGGALSFLATLRRTGAKARLADHPNEHAAADSKRDMGE